MGSRAAQLAALILLVAHFGGSSAGAIGLCDCCSGTALTPGCQSACNAARQEIPMCRPAMLYDGDAGEHSVDNALAGVSLKYLSMGQPDRPALERFRRWFETWRGRAEDKFQVVLARSDSGEGSLAEFASAEDERDHVLVNYQHGMRRYFEILRDRRKQPMVLATARAAKAAVSAAVCTGKGINEPCVVAEVTLAPVASHDAASRREVRRKRIALRKPAQQKLVQQKLVQLVVRIAKTCNGNWVNAACAAP
jgi:hypothetical protein